MELLNFAIAAVGLVVAIVALVIAVPPFAQMIHGPPKVRLAFDVSTEQGATLLLCAIHNLPVNSWFLKKIGVTRTPTEVFAVFDIREHGTNKIIVNSFRAPHGQSGRRCYGSDSCCKTRPASRIFGC